MHISEKIAQYLIENKFAVSTAENRDTVFKSFRKFDHLAGNMTDGTRLVTIAMDDTGRWLERHDGWGRSEKCVDLRNYWEKEAIDAINDLMA